MGLLSSKTTEGRSDSHHVHLGCDVPRRLPPTNGKSQSMRITWLIWDIMRLLLWSGRNVSGTPQGSSGYLTENIYASCMLERKPFHFEASIGLCGFQRFYQGYHWVQLVQWESHGFVTEKLGLRNINSQLVYSMLIPWSYRFLQRNGTNKCPMIVYRREDYYNWTSGKPLLKGFFNIPSGTQT